VVQHQSRVAKKGKRSLDAELNLVPFIDLLSSLISFLLLTAVWTTMSRQQVHETGGLSDSDSTPEPNTTELRLTVGDSGYIVFVGGQGASTIAKVDGKYNQKDLVTRLTAVRDAFASQKNITVAVEDTVKFEDLTVAVDYVESVKKKNPDGTDSEDPVFTDISISAAVN